MQTYYKNLSLTNIQYIDIYGVECIEAWKSIEGFEKYEVSDLGRVKALPKVTVVNDVRRSYGAKILKQSLKDTGYLTVFLYSEEINKICKVHRLVGTAFFKNPLNKRTINHKNTIKTDNFKDNLEWSTHSENHIHAYKNGRKSGMKGLKGELNPMVKLVHQYETNGVLVGTYFGIYEAQEKTGIPFRMISRVCKGYRQITHGFRWRYEENKKTV